ncbi:hypothetical protein GCM10027413_21530 [Conyzicola nivalis]|uniref:Uncharacterized protein n=1 Tax=Conyzicola nivalis TaxID=1477021 RepID=A0A916SCM8_9MICO|nr:hypothetical protein [Conyzicola nivalis]GGA93496.1 hypothetical protein GCM10010979_05090 [Conyzicola nivalis]
MNDLTAIVGPTPGPGHGECFIWTRGSDTAVVAVDAGGAASMGKHAGAHDPEILILSHDDSDHIRGAVELINTARSSLRELWIPAEWAILIKQIAETNQNALLPDNAITVSVGGLAASIAGQITTIAEGAGGNQLTPELLALAGTNLSSWAPSTFRPDRGFSIEEPPRKVGRWYGAKDLSEIVKRVRYRAKALIGILTAALANSVRIRFFSIDLALSSTSKTWETEGRPGTATLVNASEAPHALAVRIPPGLPYTYALTRLTVQNRRALCTLLWSNPSSPNGGTVIWSDTDGNWLDHSSPLGLDQVISTLSASSAPHHASANAAHNRVWTELSRASGKLIMISAGGQKGQSYRPEYDALKSRRCCTWCRPASTIYQEVKASSAAPGGMNLHNTCIGAH